ncbi:MAG: L,D-transpeptidase family protein [Candidatus Latescibacterota bacterium]
MLTALGVSGATPEAQVERIVVEKANRTMRLMHGETTVRSYSICLGRRPQGPKRCRGDGRTPEGHYVIDGRNGGSRYHRSLHISYPSRDDVRASRKRGCRPGGSIMIHGLPNERHHRGPPLTTFDWTNGCIAVTNAEIEEIWRLVPDGTPIEIRP